MAAKDSSHDAASSRTRTPIRVAAVLLGIYIAMYLAVAGIIHALTSPDAAVAFVPDGSMTPSAAGSPSPSPAGVGESPPSASLGQISARPGNTSECEPRGLDSKCTFY